MPTREGASSEVVSLYTTEDETTEYDDDTPMTVTELQDSIRRVLGVNQPTQGAAHSSIKLPRCARDRPQKAG
ncbi:hypothetical protein ACFCZY_18195 [Streptomyces sp. NPDC056237]|uniref:hypothetical protein n=1 Tax=unclassified Streptomyces TaxID=2593676 RepID=UPI0035D85B7C